VSDQAPAPQSTNATNNSSSSSSTTTTTPSFPLYVVGPATSRTLASLLSTSSSRSPHSILTPLNPQIFGSHTGNGEALAHYILQHYHSFPGPTLPLLFLVGEQRRAIIPNTLMDPSLPSTKQIRVEEHVVYETGVMESFARDFASQLSQNEKDPKSSALAAVVVIVVVVVVFSPSGCEAMLRCLGYIDSENQLTDRGKSRGPDKVTAQTRYVIATIGPTTRDYLKREFGFEADVCAETPSPEGVGEEVKKFLGWKSRSEDMVVG
jgi:uroporphyrinogen-III synthase